MTKSAKLIQIEAEMEALRRQVKAKEDERAAELSRIWLARKAKEKPKVDEVAFVTFTLSKHLRNGDFVKVTGARSGPIRRVVELHGEGGWYGDRKWSPGGLSAEVFSSHRDMPKRALHDIRYCGIEKVSHVYVDGKWVKVKDYVEQYRPEPLEG